VLSLEANSPSQNSRLICARRRAINPHLQTFTREECNNYSRLPAVGQIEGNLL
jgi:hypothetical protein